MNKKQQAKRIYQAIEKIDPEWLYDARAYRAPKITPYIRYIAAAAVALVILSSILIIKAANTVKYALTVDTNYGVTLEINGSNRVVKATASATLYKLPAESCLRMDGGEAIAGLTEIMGERGGLNEHANTLLFGVSEGSDAFADALIAGFDTDQYCVIRVGYNDAEDVRTLAKKRRITAGKAALLLSLNQEKSAVKENRLFRLSANDIALLMENKRIVSEGVSITGKPLDGGCLSAEQVKQIAVKSAGIIPEKAVCELDSNGFKLVYNVLLYRGKQGAAYVIGAESGAILWEYHGDASVMHTELEKAHETYGEASESAPPYQTTPDPSPVTSEASTELPYVSASTELPYVSASQNPATSTPEPTVDQHLSPTTAPTEKAEPIKEPDTQKDKPDDATSAPTDSPSKTHTYLTAKQWDELPPLDDIRVVHAALCGSTPFSANDRYGSCLMESAQAAAEYRADEPSRSIGIDYESTDYDNHSLAAVETRERFSNENLNTAIFFIRGDILYVGVFEHTVNTPLQKGDRDIRYDYMIPKNELSGVKQLKMVQLSYDDVFSSSLMSVYYPDSRLNNLKRNTWCEDIPEDIFNTKYMVNANLRLFNNTLLYPYPREINLSDNNDAYDHTAWLIRSGTGLLDFKRSVDSKIANLNYPSDTYMLNHALLMTTYVERYNVYSYYVRAWKKDGVLYVAFTDESSGGIARSPLNTPYLRVGMIEFEYEQVKDVDRVEIVHVKNRSVKTGTEFVAVAPWD